MPDLNIFLGVQGSGKTTLYNSLKSQNANLGKMISFDDFFNASITNEVIGVRNYAENINSALMSSQSFSIETAKSSPAIIDIIKRAKANSYKIQLFYVALGSLELCKERIKIRVKNNGHNIDSKIVDYSFGHVLDYFDSLLNEIDCGYFYDNSISMQLVAKYSNGNFCNIDNNCKWIKDIISTSKSL